MANHQQLVDQLDAINKLSTEERLNFLLVEKLTLKYFTTQVSFLELF